MKRLMVLLATLALVAVGCGDSGGSSGVASLESADTAALAAGDDTTTGDGTAASEIDSEEALLAFTQCLRDQGLDVPDPEVDADGNLRLGGRPGGEGEDFDREAFQAARQACADILEGVSLGFRAVDRTALEDTLVSYAACMRENGYQMADPDFDDPGPGGGPGGGGGPFGAIDREDPAFITANAACEEILASAFGPDGPGVGPGRGPGAAPGAGNG